MMRAPLGCAYALFLASAACGGGGASGDGGGAPPLAPLISIDGSNARAVAASVWLGSSASTTADVLPYPVRDVLGTHFALLALRPNGLPVDLGCGVSGSAQLDGVVADPAKPGLSAGDRVTVLYLRCLGYEDALIPVMEDGTLVVEVTSSSSDARTLSVTYQALKAGIAESQLYTQRGSATFTLSHDGSSASFATERLIATGAGQTLIVEGFQQSFTSTGTGHLLTVRGTRSGGDLAGSVSVDTPNPIHVPSGGHPDAGELVITGAAGSSVAVQAESDGVHVLLVVNGGVPVETTWNDLEG